MALNTNVCPTLHSATRFYTIHAHCMRASATLVPDTISWVRLHPFYSPRGHGAQVELVGIVLKLDLSLLSVACTAAYCLSTFACILSSRAASGRTGLGAGLVTLTCISGENPAPVYLLGAKI
jgi:hypothetical protein